MLAFETAKRLDSIEGATGTAVQFLGNFNLPPHIKSRMRQLSWNMRLLHLAQFLGLTTESYVEETEMSTFPTMPRNDALAQVIRAADVRRLEELGLQLEALERWADVAYGLQSMAVDYEPNGQVGGIDVFHALPLKAAASSREEWIGEHLSKWQ
ncbi:hypothetical protein F4802DRAFT_612909 [Xylaria palmicola]|nr:hypothetical protein F4802DRAFT_612909 [Xylaria palmicola]